MRRGSRCRLSSEVRSLLFRVYAESSCENRRETRKVKLRIAAYMGQPSHYQDSFYRALAKHCNLRVIFAAHLSPARREMGWSEDLFGYDYVFNPTLSETRKVLNDTETFHFLNGFPGTMMNVLRNVHLRNSYRMATQTELPPLEQFGRTTLDRTYAYFVRRYQISVLGIGAPARTYLREVGVPGTGIFPFGYFTDAIAPPTPTFAGPCFYIGRLVGLKRVDLLIRAFAQSLAASSDRPLVIVGDGPERRSLEQLAREMLPRGITTFLGARSPQMVQELLQGASSLVLPSTGPEGWGVVVNEAISSGVPVIVSDACGAAELVDHGGCGFVVKAGDVDQLAVRLDLLYSSSRTWDAASRSAVHYASAITPDVAAQYFLSLVSHIRSGNDSEPAPLAPWLERRHTL